MSTLATYTAGVQLKGYDSVATATIEAAVQEARRRVLTDARWSFAEASNQSLVTTAGTQGVSTTGIANLGWIDNVAIYDTTSDIYDPLPYGEFPVYQELIDGARLTGAARGRPYFWTRRVGGIIFYPTPDRAYTVIIDYHLNAVDITTTDTVIPDQHRDLVVWAAVAVLAFRQRDYQAAQAADQMYSKVLLPRAIAQDRVDQTQAPTRIKTGYWRS